MKIERKEDSSRERSSDKEKESTTYKSSAKRNLLSNPLPQRSHRGTESSRGVLSSGSESRKDYKKINHNISKSSSKDSEISSDSGPEVGIKRNREEAFKQPKTRPLKSPKQSSPSKQSLEKKQELDFKAEIIKLKLKEDESRKKNLKLEEKVK